MRMATLFGLGCALVACGSARAPETETTITRVPPVREPAPAAENPADAGAPDAGAAITTLFDGTLGPEWRMSTIKNQPGRDDPGRFAVEDGTLVAYPGTDLGLLWHTRPRPADFLRRLEWEVSAPDDNSGIFVRFPDLDSKGYDNTAWVAVDFGFEIQINEPGVPDGAPMHTTGAVYGQPDQRFTRVVAKPPGAWNEFAVRVVGATIAVTMNGRDVTSFENHIAGRGLASTPEAPSLVGLQTHAGHVAYRNIRLRAL